MEIRPIRTDTDHEAMLREVEMLWGAPVGSEQGDRLNVLVTLIEDYEKRRWPIDPLDPVTAIEVAMEENGHTRADLAGLIGQSRATEILNRSRALTLPMIRKIARAWHVPEKILVQEYRLEK